jgi:hypothetical protein
MTRTVLRRVQDGMPASPAQDFEHSQVTPPPCDGCECAVTCRVRLLACRAFAQYIRTGRWKEPITRRLPSRRPYLRLFRV